MKEPTIRNGKQEIIAWIDRWSDKRESVTDKNGKRLGTFETDTGVTKDASGKLVGHRASQLLRFIR